MTITREPACRTKGCPWPRNEEAHIPWCLHIEGVEHRRDQPWHQHHPKKGMGAGRKEARIVAVLCSYCSDRVDNTPDWDNDITPGEDGKLEYILWDTRVEGGWNSPLICRPIDPAAGEQPNRELPLDSAVSRQVDRATPAAGSGRKEVMPVDVRPTKRPQFDQRVEEGVEAGQGASGEDSAAEDGKAVGVSRRRLDRQGAAPISAISEDDERLGDEKRRYPSREARPVIGDSSAAPPLTHDERMGIAAEIRREQKQRQWRAGDTANAWEREMGEAAWQYLSDFGYQPEALSNIMKVCEAIPSERRHFEMGFTHHIVVYKLNAEDQEAWLDRCESEGWKVREFRVAVHGEKPKVKRWTLEELHAALDAFVGTVEGDAIREAHYESGTLFLAWLEAK